MGSCRQIGLALSFCSAAFAWLLAPPPSAGADGIAVVTNDRGEKVYVNNAAAVEAPRPSTPEPCRSRPCSSARHEATSIARSDAPTAASPTAVTTLEDLIDQAAARHHVDPQLVEAIVQVESQGNPHALSSKGAQGLMQLIPATSERLGVEDPYDPRQNVEGGVSYLRYLLDRFGGDVTLALAGYNAGENSVISNGGVPPIKETQDYVRKVNELYSPGTDATGGASQSPRPKLTPVPVPPPIYRYIDDQGIVHFTNE